MTGQADLLPGLDSLDLPNLDNLPDVPAHKWEPLLAHMRDVVEAAFKRDGVDEAGAAKLASTAVAAIAFSIGGAPVYIPRGERLKQALADIEIHASWQRGISPEQLAQDHDVSLIHVYRVIARQRKAHLARTQLPLFSEKGEG